MTHAVVFLLDVDNTLLDNDRVIEDLRGHLVQAIGSPSADRYWVLFEQLRIELGYADYLEIGRASCRERVCLAV